MTPATRLVRVHLTPFAPRIPHDARMNDACRWASIAQRTALDTLAWLAERLELGPARMGFRATHAGEVEVFNASHPTAVMAILVEGLDVQDLQDARARHIRTQHMRAA